jgi:ABC-2 type transport system ATP-binding protein
MGEARGSGEPVATLEGVTKRYGPVVAVDRLSLTVRKGEVLAVLGPNGAGKTTTVSLLMGLTRPTEGRVALMGGSPLDPASRRRVGALLQVAHVPDTLRVAEQVELFASYYPSPMPVSAALAAAGLTGLERRLIGKLSGGQKQRVLFAMALVGNPDLLFLDEPTVGLDVESRRGFWAVIRQLVAAGRTVVLTTHYLEEADALADRIVVIDRGKVIAQGTPAEIKSRGASRRVRATTRLSDGELKALPGVTSLRRDGAAAELLTSSAEATVRELLSRDATVADLEVTGAALEDAFLALTKEAA